MSGFHEWHATTVVPDHYVVFSHTQWPGQISARKETPVERDAYWELQYHQPKSQTGSTMSRLQGRSGETLLESMERCYGEQAQRLWEGLGVLGAAYSLWDQQPYVRVQFYPSGHLQGTLSLRSSKPLPPALAQKHMLGHSRLIIKDAKTLLQGATRVMWLSDTERLPYETHQQIPIPDASNTRHARLDLQHRLQDLAPSLIPHLPWND